MLKSLVKNTQELRGRMGAAATEKAPKLRAAAPVRSTGAQAAARQDPRWDLLVKTLQGAAQLEHGLACAYLYAAYSIKRPGLDALTPEQEELTRAWRTTFHLVARQEMEHLAMVTNMLNAMGEKPCFDRIPFPIDASEMPEGLPLTLRPLDATTLQTFILWERPRMSDLAPLRRKLRELDGGSVTPVPFVGPDGNVLPDSVFSTDKAPTTIYDVYRTILDTFEALCDEYGPQNVFVGDPRAQYSGTQINFRVIVQTIASADDVRSAVYQILEEGEGMPFEPETMGDTHFARYVEMYGQFCEAKARGFDAARPTVQNPTTDPANVTRMHVTDPVTAKVADAFDLAYDTMCLMLDRFYAHLAEDGPGRLRALEYATFMPMMTNLIRPLGEILSQMPATDKPASKRAGPPFQGVPAEPGPFWSALDARFERLKAQLKDAADAAAVPYPAESKRLLFVHENLDMMVDRFWTYTGEPSRRKEAQ